MDIYTLVLGVVSLAIGGALGYYIRLVLAKKKEVKVDAKVKQKLEKAGKKAKKEIENAKREAEKIKSRAKKEQRKVLKAQKELSEKNKELEREEKTLQRKKNEVNQKTQKVRDLKEKLEGQEERVKQKLEEVSNLSEEAATEELLEKVEKNHKQEIMQRMKKLEKEGEKRYERRANEILASTIQKYALSQVQDITTSTVSIPSDDIKGRIIGKEGRNIRRLEKLTGVEVVVDETPETVIVSGFDPVRRQIAKNALQELIKDGRIQPARIEKEVKKAEEKISAKIKKAGKQAAYKVGIVDLPDKIIQLLGRLKFRTSYGQNVLLHSIEVAHLAAGLAAEVGGDKEVAKKAGLLHDIGKAVDHEIEGGHVDIGMKILNKFEMGQEVINAMKSHHEDYEAESLEAVLVQVADQISGARPGARKDTLDKYLKRLEELENIATSFRGIKKAYAIQAGREIRAFVEPEKIDNLAQSKIAKEIAKKIEKELNYPGEIKVTVIRENRITDYAR